MTRSVLDLAHERVVPALIRLAAPNLLVVASNTATTAFDAYFVGFLGTEALAGLALVFPLMSLMLIVAISGVGGGAASAVARALGARNAERASAVVLHSLAIALVAAAACSALAWLAGPTLYAALGGRGPALAAAISFSDTLFAGAVASWLFCMLTAVVRGSGNMRLTAGVISVGSLLHLGIAPLLMFGSPLWPPLGIRGLALSYIGYHGLATVVLLLYVLKGSAGFRLQRGALQHGIVLDVLRVGLPVSANQVLLYLGVLVVTGLAAGSGTAAVAAYGLATRLEFTQLSLVNSLGTALVTLVGACVGADEYRRGLQFAWSGAAIASALTGVVGIVVGLVPALWLGLFTDSPDVLAFGTAYLRVVAFTYPVYGLGAALFFASQGAGKVFWAVTAGILRFAVAAGAGWVLVRVLDVGFDGVWLAVAAAFLAYGGTLAIAVRAGALAPDPASVRTPL